MLRLLGSPKRVCSGLTRRDWMHLGGLALFGLGLSDFLRLQPLQAAGPREGRFGQARDGIANGWQMTSACSPKGSSLLAHLPKLGVLLRQKERLGGADRHAKEFAAVFHARQEDAEECRLPDFQRLTRLWFEGFIVVRSRVSRQHETRSQTAG